MTGTKKNLWKQTRAKAECTILRGFQGHSITYCPSPMKYRLMKEGKYPDSCLVGTPGAIPHHRGAEWTKRRSILYLQIVFACHYSTQTNAVKYVVTLLSFQEHVTSLKYSLKPKWFHLMDMDAGPFPGSGFIEVEKLHLAARFPSNNRVS